MELDFTFEWIFINAGYIVTLPGTEGRINTQIIVRLIYHLGIDFEIYFRYHVGFLVEEGGEDNHARRSSKLLSKFILEGLINGFLKWVAKIAYLN